MSEGWEKWLADLGTEPLGTLLHLGAGQGRLLDAVRNTGARQIVLVEAAPRDAAALARRTASDDRVSVIPAAVAASTGRATLHQYNMAALSSLRAPTSLSDLFPGLRETATVEVDTLTAAELLKHLPPPSEQPDVLLLETPGTEAEVLQGLIAAGGLSRFRDIFLRAGREAFYDDGSALPELLALLRREGFTPFQRSDADPDFPKLHLRIDQVARENRALRAELSTARQVALSQEARSAGLEAAAEALKGKLEDTHVHTETLKAELDKAHIQTETLKAELADARETSSRELETVRAHQAELETALAEAGNRENKARQDLSLALRLQSLRDADIAALERKYADLLRQKESQDELLGKLTARLSSAARYLHQLELAEDSAADPQLEKTGAQTTKPRTRGRKTGKAT